jgi:hypothetical protein
MPRTSAIIAAKRQASTNFAIVVCFDVKDAAVGEASQPGTGLGYGAGDCQGGVVRRATFPLPLEREQKETMPSLPGNGQRPDPVELFGAALVFLPISGTPDHERSPRRPRRLSDGRKQTELQFTGPESGSASATTCFARHTGLARERWCTRWPFSRRFPA